MSRPTQLPITIRPAYADDASALSRLAILDSATVPAGPLLVAEVEGELHAALAIDGGAVIADPFQPTAATVELLRHHRLSLSIGSARYGSRITNRVLRPAAAAGGG